MLALHRRTKDALFELEHHPVRKCDLNPIAFEQLSEMGLIEQWKTDIGAYWTRISEAGSAVIADLKAATGKVN